MKYLCKQVDADDGYSEVDVWDAETAAEHYFNAFIRGYESSGDLDGMQIAVRSPDGEEQLFTVDVKLEPVYYIRKIEAAT